MPFSPPSSLVVEVELKGVVTDEAATRARIEAAGGILTFDGHMADRRYDTPDGRFARGDVVLRLRVYEPSGGGAERAQFDWKGPSTTDSGYKVREELSTSAGDSHALASIFDRLGLVVTREIDRHVTQYTLGGAVVRFERYPRMDVLLEVEGAPDAIEQAIVVSGIPREDFSEGRLLDFVARYERRTGQWAALNDAELEPDDHA